MKSRYITKDLIQAIHIKSIADALQSVYNSAGITPSPHARARGCINHRIIIINTWRGCSAVWILYTGSVNGLVRRLGE